MICEKCKRDFDEKLIDGHHIHPQFMDNKHGKVNDKVIMLCDENDRGCHYDLHKTIVNPILWKYARVLKKINSEHWLWIKVLPIDKEGCIKEVIKETEGWLNGDIKPT